MILALALALALGWEPRAAVPLARSEVAAATVGGQIAVVGGFLSDGSSSRRVESYAPAADAW